MASRPGDGPPSQEGVVLFDFLQAAFLFSLFIATFVSLTNVKMLTLAATQAEQDALVAARSQLSRLEQPDTLRQLVQSYQEEARRAGWTGEGPGPLLPMHSFDLARFPGPPDGVPGLVACSMEPDGLLRVSVVVRWVEGSAERLEELKLVTLLGPRRWSP